MLKCYAVGNTFSGLVHTEYLTEEELATYSDYPQLVVRPLKDDESTLAVRYQVLSGEIVDKHPEMSDEQILQSIKVDNTPGLNDLDTLKKEKISKIRRHFDNTINRIKKDAAEYEVATWDTQRIEYADWVSDKAASTPYVDALAQGRGIDRDVLMAKIGVKVSSMATLQGIQHALEGRVEQANSPEEVISIEIPNL